MSEANSTNFITLTQSVNSESIDELIKFRMLWWNEGKIHPQARWEQVKLPYTLVEDVSLKEYEYRTDKFNIHGFWEWVENKVIIYEFPSKPHKTLIGEIVKGIMMQCITVYKTDADIGYMGTVQTCADNTGCESDATFRPSKPRVQSPTGSDGVDEPWPNLVVEVAYTESENHILNKIQSYWLQNYSRVHDAIVIKIDEVPKGQTPTRMQAWHFCVSDRTRRNAEIEPRKYVMS